MDPQQPYRQQPYPPQPQAPWQPMPGGPRTGGYQQAIQQQPRPPHPPAPVKKRRKWPWIVGGIVVLLLILIFSSAGSGRTGGSAGTTSTVGSQTSAQQAAVPVVPAAPPKPITARDWAKIAKDPGSHVGEAIIVYGEVTQFDSATGTTTFRANVDGVKHPVSYGFANYPTNTVLSGNASGMSDLVQGDLFQAEAVVAGSISYQNTMGGSLSAPQLTVLKVTVIGSTK